MELIERIKANAELVIQQFPDQELGYDERSVEWLDGFIERQRVRLEADKFAGISQTLGSFLGECIRRNFGGNWDQMNEGLAIVFDEQNCCFPINKVEKQFTYGAEDSVLSFYQMIPIVFNLENPTGDEENAD